MWVDRGLSKFYCYSPVTLHTAGCELTGGWALCYCDSPVLLHTAGCELTGVEPPATVTGSHPCIPQVVDRGWAPATVTARLLAYSRVWVDRGWASATVSARPFHTTCVSWQGLSHLLRWQPRPLHTAGCELTGVEPPATVRAPHPCIQQGVSWPGLSSCYCDSPPPCIQRVWVDRELSPLLRWQPRPLAYICVWVDGVEPLLLWQPVHLHTAGCKLTGGWAPATVTAPSPCIKQGVSWLGLSPWYCDSPAPLYAAGCKLTGVEPLLLWQPYPLAHSRVWVDTWLSPRYRDSPSSCIYLTVARYSSPYLYSVHNGDTRHSKHVSVSIWASCGLGSFVE